MDLKSIILLLYFCTFSMVASTSMAATEYSYTGFQYYNFSSGDELSVYDETMSISGTMVLSSPLPPNLSDQEITPLSFSFNDGVNTVTRDNSDFEFFSLSTDEFGDITYWQIVVNSGSPLELFEVGDQFGPEDLHA